MSYRTVSDGNRALAIVAACLGVAAIALAIVVLIDPNGDVLGMSGTLIAATVTQPYQAAIVASIFGVVCLAEAVLARLDIRGASLLGALLSVFLLAGLAFQCSRIGFGFPGQVLPLVLGFAMLMLSIMVAVHRKRRVTSAPVDPDPIQPMPSKRAAAQARRAGYTPVSPIVAESRPKTPPSAVAN